MQMKIVISGLSPDPKVLKSKGLEIKRFRKGLVKIVEDNLKPYNKLVYAIQEYPEANIITCDDDMVYKNNFKLLEAYHEISKVRKG